MTDENKVPDEVEVIKTTQDLHDWAAATDLAIRDWADEHRTPSGLKCTKDYHRKLTIYGYNSHRGYVNVEYRCDDCGEKFWIRIERPEDFEYPDF